MQRLVAAADPSWGRRFAGQRMDANGSLIRFLGDLDDPWVQGLLESLRGMGEVCPVCLAGEVPERLLDLEPPAPRLVVLHRARLSLADALRIDRSRPPGRDTVEPRLILCYSPYVRYAELERCVRAVEVALPEATAIETLPRHASRLLGLSQHASAGPAPSSPLPVRIRSSNVELRAVLAEVCSAAGLTLVAEPEGQPGARGTRPAPAPRRGPVLTLHDVAVLEPDWPRRIGEDARYGPVVALAGFLDRSVVLRAKASGAAACLDLPVDPGDLVDVVERVSRVQRADAAGPIDSRAEAAHSLPPAPASRSTRGRAAILARPMHPPGWPEPAHAPTIPSEKPA